jgi:hypothetical protein
MKTLFFQLAFLSIAPGVYSQSTEVHTDSIYLFTNKESSAVADTSSRQLSAKYLQITNIVGIPVTLKFSRNLNDWTSVTINSPEKKVFTTPHGINELYVIIDPENPKAVKRLIKRNNQYELYFNMNTNLFDLKSND